MRLFRFAVLWVLAFTALQASVTARRKPPPPGWPTEDYATVVARCHRIDLVVFEFRGGRKIFVTDSRWLDEFKATLADAGARPDAICFCISEPTIKLYAKDQLVCSFELVHDNKVRFGGSDFIVPAETHQALAKLLSIALKSERHAPARKSPKHDAPIRVDLKP